MNELSRVYAHIDEHFDRHLDRVRAFVRQPSISGEGLGMQEMAALVASSIQELGGRSEVVATSGWPVVYGEINAGAPRTMLLPHEVTVKMDVRLVQDMEPDEVHRRLRAHLRKIGCEDFEEKIEEGYPCARMSPRAPISQATLLSVPPGAPPAVHDGRDGARRPPAQPERVRDRRGDAPV